VTQTEKDDVVFKTSQDVKDYTPSRNRLFSATHEEIRGGATADVYFVRTQEILELEGKDQTVVTAEIFSGKSGIVAGTPECLELLRGLPLEIWGVPEGDPFSEKDTILRITGPYSLFGPYETALLGILASSSGWATAARECKNAVPDAPFYCFGARHIHPAVAPVMERAAVIGGADGAACILGAKLAGLEPVGTIPHALVLILGDTVKTAMAYHTHMPPDAPRTILVDTFHDEAEEALRVAEALGKDMGAVRLDTPAERGGVTEGLVREVRARLDLAGFGHVKIFVSGGLNPERMQKLRAAGADAFGVGHYISSAKPLDMTMDIKVIEGQPIAKRGRIPGLSHNPRLRRLV
jgi:nicotinate phosphoribosyltransferase